MSVMSVKVRGNAPNWPAMCEKVTVKKKEVDPSVKNQIDYIKSASSSLWFESKCKPLLKKEDPINCIENRMTSQRKTKKPENAIVKNKWANSDLFAICKVVRQCPKCQVLYTDKHDMCNS